MRDMMGMMKQAQALQAKIAAAQAELDKVMVEGSSGGGLVNVTMSAKGELKSVRIDPSLMQPGDAEILEDLVLAAFNDAKARADRAVKEQMQDATKGIPLPPGMNLF
jgi:nucleoid-associated protein EbfC